MFRGFRWQLIALFVSFAVFAGVLITQSPDDSVDTSPIEEPTSPPSSVGANTPTVVETPPTETTVQAETMETQDDVTLVMPRSIYREALVGGVQRLNPVLASLNPVDRDITALIFEGLIRINEYGEPQPALARDWVVSFDNLEYVFTLRDDVLWQDGTSFTADDVVFTMSLLADADFPGDAQLSSFWRTVEIERLGDYLVRFRLAQPLGNFLEALRIGILPEHALRNVPAGEIAAHPFNLSPIGTGPYQLDELTIVDGRIVSVILRRAPIYQQRVSSRIQLEYLQFTLFDSFEDVLSGLGDGVIDGYAARNQMERQSLLNLASRSDDFSVISAVEPVIGTIVFNWANESLPIFNDRRMRQSLQIGLERVSIIERHLSNVAVVADSPIPLNSWAHNANIALPAYDVTLAGEFLNRVSLPETVDDTEETEESTDTSEQAITLRLLTPDIPALVNVAQEIAAQWNLIAPELLNVRVEPENADTYLLRLETGDFEVALVELSKEGNADPDVYPFWHQGQYPEGQNYGGANDRETSELLERGRQDPSGTNRIIYYHEFQQAFVDNAIGIPLYYPLFTYIVRETLEGVQLGYMSSASDRFLTIADWQLGM